jgi:hypothetical protein
VVVGIRQILSVIGFRFFSTISTEGLSLMSTRIIRPVSLALLVAAIFFLAPGSLWAAAINIDDTSPNETITITANDFEFGLNLNGALFQQGLGNPATVTLPEDAVGLSFSGEWITFNQQGPVDRTIYLIESPAISGTAPPLVSDILRFVITPNTDNGTATINGTFVSDVNDNLGTLPVGTSPNDVFLETGNPVTLNFVGLSLSVTSDIEVPEPSTWALGVAAAMGMVLFGRLRSRHQVLMRQ